MDLLTFEEFTLLLGSQLEQSNVPAHLWQSLHEKISNEIYDANNFFQINPLRIVSEEDPDDVSFDSEVCTNNAIKANDPASIFIIDHAWTFQMADAKKHLKENSNLSTRIAQLMDIPIADDQDSSELVDKVMDYLWKYCDFYSIHTPDVTSDNKNSSTDLTCIWYVLDEFGARIHHDESPTCRLVPLFYQPRQICYSIMWPVQDLEEGDLLTCDKMPQIARDHLRKYYIQPWIYEDVTEEQLPPRQPLNKQHFEAHRMAESYPDVEHVEAMMKLKNSYQVYSDVAFVTDNLTDSRFSLTNDYEQADVLWLYDHFKDFKSLSINRPNTFINQFPNEAILTVKDLLAAVSHGHAWYPLTFNLKTEIDYFVREFQQKEKKILNGELEENKNIWIVKPWNMGRGIGIVVTNNLDQILRVIHTAPMIASEYIANPVLFYRPDLDVRVKFDIRYMLLVKSIKPLELAVYNVFWLRFANKQFRLTDFDDYETHFTVMNYRHPQELKQINCEEFVGLFQDQYPKFPWKQVETKIHSVLREIMTVATAQPAPFSLAHSPQSRAIYAVDLLLEWIDDGESDLRPVVCEANYCPDCTRACKYHPDFFNDIFAYFFFDECRNITRL